VFGYDSQTKKQEVVFLNKGKGGLEALNEYFTQDSVVFAILGVVFDEGDFSSVKKLFLTWVGPAVKPMVRARSSQHRVSLYNFANKHVALAGEVSAQDKDELTQKKLIEKLENSFVTREGDSSKAQQAVAQQRAGAAQTKGKEHFEFTNEEDAKQAIADVRSESTKTTWVVFGSESNKDTLTVLGKGPGGLDDFSKFFSEDNIVYVVYAVTVAEKGEHGGDDYNVVKNIFISWVGSNTKPLVKARSSQQRFALYTYLKQIIQLHGELQLLNPGELTNDLILQKLAGTRVL
jgi:hypothetical protein